MGMSLPFILFSSPLDHHSVERSLRSYSDSSGTKKRGFERLSVLIHPCSNKMSTVGGIGNDVEAQLTANHFGDGSMI